MINLEKEAVLSKKDITAWFIDRLTSRRINAIKVNHPIIGTETYNDQKPLELVSVKFSDIEYALDQIDLLKPDMLFILEARENIVDDCTESYTLRFNYFKTIGE